jgi:hypothetical protein
MSAAKAVKLWASPTELRKTAATSGPNATNQGRWMRSESQPNRGWESDEAKEETASRTPTLVRERPSLVIRRGRRGGTKEE